jgi:hypothetical protein
MNEDSTPIRWLKVKAEEESSIWLQNVMSSNNWVYLLV